VSELEEDEEAEAPKPPVDVLLGWTEPGEEGTTVLRLEETVKVGRNSITRLVFARLRAKHMRVMKGDSVDSLLLVAQEMTNEPRAVIDKLGPLDAARTLEVVRRGFSSGPATGGAS
jgi:hypothetical protein